MNEELKNKQTIDYLKSQVELYQKEIEEYKKILGTENDERKIKHTENLLLESQKVLTSLLGKIYKYEDSL